MARRPVTRTEIHTVGDLIAELEKHDRDKSVRVMQKDKGFMSEAGTHYPGDETECLVNVVDLESRIIIEAGDED